MSERSRRRKTTTPSAAYFVGYVEDAESIAAIEKKFEALAKYEEQLKATSKNEDASKNQTAVQDELPEQEIQPEQLLSEKQLEDIFMITSAFTVNKVQEEDGEQSIRLFSEDDDDDDSSKSDGSGDEWCGMALSKKRKRKKKPKKEKRVKAVHEKKVKEAKKSWAAVEVADPAGFLLTIKKRGEPNPKLPQYSRIPEQYPLPLSWAFTISPFSAEKSEKRKKTDPSVVVTSDLLRFLKTNGGWEQITAINEKLNNIEKTLHGFSAIVIDPPWKLTGEDEAGRVTPNDLKNLLVPTTVLPAGFIFCWIEKEYLTEMILLMKSWGFIYVETLVWVKKLSNNKIAQQSSQYFRRSKCSLYFFRKNSDRFIELLHQRNPDVCLDFIRRDSKGLQIKPFDFVYNVVETLLPHSEKNTSKGFLEIWSSNETPRKGWVKLIEVQGKTNND